jgi:hypothetical protein
MSFTSTLTHNVIQPNGGSVTKLYKMNEKRRQGLINLGEQQINAAFEGGSAPFYSLADYRGPIGKNGGGLGRVAARPNGGSMYAPPGQRDFGQEFRAPATPTSYFKQNGQGQFMAVANPSSKSLKRGLYFNAPETKTFEGYTDKFYNEREKAYTDFAMPQVAQQYRDAKAATLYGLANRGQIGSSLDTKAQSNLERTSAGARQAVVDNAIDQSSKLRMDLENARQAQLQQLYQSTDPSKAVASAIATSQNFRRPSSFAPIINAFANIANTYATNQAIQGYNKQAQVYGGQDQQNQPQSYVAPIN